MSHVTRADNMRAHTALKAVAQRTQLAHQLALKWGRHWLSTVKRRKLEGRSRGGKENRQVTNYLLEDKESFGKAPTDFYADFKVLRESRPAPKIPSFFVNRRNFL